MFRFSERLSKSAGTHSRQYLRRAGMFAGGLLLLWLALQLFPSTTSMPPVYSDESGSVADGEEIRMSNEGPHFFSLGNIAAIIILAGGGAFAYVAQKRAKRGRSSTSLIEDMDQLGVGQGQQLRLIRCGGDVLLVGVTANQISLLRDFDLEQFIDTADGPSHTALEHPSVRPAEALTWRETVRRDGLGIANGSKESTSVDGARGMPGRSHFADVLRQYAGRHVNAHSNGTKC